MPPELKNKFIGSLRPRTISIYSKLKHIKFRHMVTKITALLNFFIYKKTLFSYLFLHRSLLSCHEYLFFQVIPSRLPDGQVVFLLPSHYVQLTKEEEKDKSQEMPIDFSVKKSEDEVKEEEEVWRPW